MKLKERQEEKRRHLQSFVDRFKAKASKAKQAQSRVKMLEKMDEIQSGFGYFFLAEFIIRLYAAESPMSHLRKPLTLIDIFTVFPPYVGQILTFVSRKIAEQGGEGSELSQDDLGVVGDLDFLRVVRLMRLLRIITFIQGRSAQNNDVSAHILRITLTFFSVMFCFAGFYMEVERAYTADIDIHFHRKNSWFWWFWRRSGQFLTHWADRDIEIGETAAEWRHRHPLCPQKMHGLCGFGVAVANF